VDVNEAVVSSYGYGREEFANMTIYDLGPLEDMPLIYSSIEKLEDKQGIIHFGIYNHLRKDRSVIKADITGYRLNYEGRDCMMVVCNDVTEREKTLEQLKKLNLQKQARELEISNAELEQFAYVASHDLQEPLRMITSFLAKLEEKYENLIDRKGKQYIHFATDGAKRMRHLILDLLEFSRVGRTEVKIENVDLNHLIKDILALYQVRISELDAKVNFGRLPAFRTYKTPLMQVFQNLIGNSLKYHRAGVKPVIDIGYAEKKLEYEFSVSDNGIGISSEFYSKIFIVFQRLHNKDEYSGTGMGLAITKKIVENMGGRIWVDSVEGVGSTFYFTIPKNS